MILEIVEITNLGLYSEASIHINAGLNVIIGESGSGKSMLYEMLSFALGDVNLDVKLLRNPSLSGDVVLRFSDGSYVKRSLSPVGRSKVFLNDKMISLSELKDLTKKSLFLSRQHAQLSLSDPVYCLSMLDKHVDKNLLDSYRHSYKENLQILLEIKQQRQQQLSTLSLIEVQDEIDVLQKLFDRDESYDAIEEAMRSLEKSNRRILSFMEFQDGLKKANLENSSIKLYPYLNNQEKAAMDNLIEALNVWNAIVPDLYEQSVIQEKMEYYDAYLSVLYSLAKRFSVQPDKLFAYYKNKCDQLESHHAASVLLASYERDLEEKHEKLMLHAKTLSDARKAVAVNLQYGIQKALPALGMPHAALQFKFRDIDAQPSGCDYVEILLASHDDSEFLPLKQVASGGELSRILLLLASLSPDGICYLFDEVDAGISGKTAMMVGKYLYKLSRNSKVLVISHTPQVASYADCLWQLEKSYTGKPCTNVKKIVPAEHASSIATILSADITSESALIHASNLILDAKKSLLDDL